MQCPQCQHKSQVAARRGLTRFVGRQGELEQQQQGRPAEGRQRLAEVYRQFTEGFDTPDLQEARALLEGRS